MHPIALRTRGRQRPGASAGPHPAGPRPSPYHCTFPGPCWHRPMRMRTHSCPQLALHWGDNGHHLVCAVGDVGIQHDHRLPYSGHGVGRQQGVQTRVVPATSSTRERRGGGGESGRRRLVLAGSKRCMRRRMHAKVITRARPHSLVWELGEYVIILRTPPQCVPMPAHHAQVQHMSRRGFLLLHCSYQTRQCGKRPATAYSLTPIRKPRQQT